MAEVKLRGFGSKRIHRRKNTAIEPLEARHLLTIVVSEFLADNESILPDEDGNFSDWIELRNDGDSDVDLNGWYLTDNADDPTKWKFNDTSIAAGDHLLIFASGKNQKAGQLHTNFKLSNNGEYLGLVQPDGSTVEFAYAPEYPAQNDDVSYGLSADGSIRGFFSNPTPGAANATEPIADGSKSIVINELMYKLPRETLITPENTNEEFIELFNRGFEAVDVEGWRFSRGVQFTLPQATIPALGYLVVAANLESFQAKYPDVQNVVAGWTGTLANNGETIELVDNDGLQIDSVKYASQGDWAIRTVGPDDRGHTGWIWSAGHDGLGHSMELTNAAMPNDVGQNWTSSVEVGGTPGAANSEITNNSAPFISNVIHQPAIPRSDDPVLISATLLDELPTATARLHWRVDGDEAFSVVDMTDDGRNGDTTAADRTFTATIGAQPNLTVIEFYVEAIDQQNLSRTWPAPTSLGTQSANALYQVNDNYDQDELWDPTDTPVYFEVMTAAERQEFIDVDRLSNAQFNSTFISLDGTGTEVHYNTGVRIRGSASRRAAIPNNRITFPNDRPWQGVTRVNINSANPVNQVSSAALFRLAGVETADARPIQLISNGVNLKGNGYYSHLEVLDGDYAEVHYPTDGDGNVYRGRRANESPPGGGGAGLRYLGEEPLPYVSYAKNTNGSQADWSDVIHMTNVLNNSPDETYVQDVLAVVDVDQWFRAFNMNSLIGNTENGLFTGDRQGDDYAMYRGINDPRFQMIPYDMDSVYRGVNEGIVTTNGVPAIDRLIGHPEFRPLFYASYLNLIDEIIFTDKVEETLRQSVGNITNEQTIQNILTYLENRANFVLNRIDQDVRLDAGDNVVGGLARTDTPTVSISGRAPDATTESVTINNQLIEELRTNRRFQYDVASSVTIENTTLLPLGSTWKYLDDGSDQGTAWRETDFDDQAWQSGPAQLGYGEDDEATVISNGPGEENSATSYFRSTFEVDDLQDVDSATARLLFDDGAAVYLNGTEVFRDNLVADAPFDRFAEGFRGNPEERQFVPFNFDLSLLNVGTNTIAVEVHQASAGSSDVSFDIELFITKRILKEEEAADQIRLFPGVKRYTVKAFDGENGTGNVVGEDTIDVWYDNGAAQNINSNISADTTWDAESGPYLVNSNITIDADATLTIEPGTTVFFGDDGRLTIRGQLTAIGKPFQEIRFTRSPAGDNWNGLQFRNSNTDNRIEHAIIEHGVTGDGMIGLEASTLSLDHVVLDHTDRRRIRTINSSLVVRNSTFTDIFPPGVEPTTDNQSEHIWGRGIPQDGTWIIENNHFGHITGHNDSIDFDAPRLPNAIPYIKGNTFAGGGDDALDLTGDNWIEGNTFRNFIKDEFNVDPGQSNTISSSEGDFWIIGNVFDNVQHATLVKENAFSHFIGNTVVNSSFAPVYFDLPGQTDGPGRGAIVENSVFASSASTFDYIQPDTDLTVRHSFMSDGEDQFAGNGNLFGNAHVGGDAENYELRNGSLAIGAGTIGQDMGARAGLGAQLVGVPEGTTRSRTATITVGGFGITEYRYQLNNGPLSNPISIDQPIVLNGLQDGDHQLLVLGKNQIGIWQTEPTLSNAWTVDQAYAPPVILSEILADNDSIDVLGATPDLIEIHNPGDAPVDLAGFSLTDNVTVPDKFVFPANSIVAARGFITLVADVGSNQSIYTGFSLNDQGDEVYLFDANQQNRNVIDSVQFGRQLSDRSISQIDGEWKLSRPTVNQPNDEVPVADSTDVVINEWYATGQVRIEQDFVELYNRSEFPVNVGNHFVSDRPFAIPDMSQFGPLTFIDGHGFWDLTADGVPESGPNHVDFRLSPQLEQIGLFDPNLNRIDVVFSMPQTSEVASGRSPDGSGTFDYFNIPSPGATNVTQEVEVESFGFDWSADWKYENSGADQGTAWRAPEFDDAAWPSGPGPLGREFEAMEHPIETLFDELGDITYYFRREFEIPADANLTEATILTQVDDGFIVYLNGQEVVRRGMPDGDVAFDVLANRNVNEAQVEGPFDVPVNLLRPGRNVFAVEVHQTRLNSSDLVFGMEFIAESVSVEQSSLEVLTNSLRISEIMYNSPGDDLHDFIEITNVSNQPVALGGVRLSDGIDFEFPQISLQPNQHVVVAENAAAFLQQYGSGANLVGEYSGQLSNSGEEIALQLPSPFDAAIVRVDYSDAWYPVTDGGGRSLEFVDPLLRFDRWSEASVWRASDVEGGTPGGTTAPAQNGPAIVINEVLTHTDPPQSDSIELLNVGDSVVDLSRWYLTDSNRAPQKFQIPAGTLLASGGFAVFDESDFNASLGVEPQDFALDGARGDRVVLWETGDGGRLLRIVDAVEFGAAKNGESFGRVASGQGVLYPLEQTSFGQANADPRVGPIVISEVNYHPADPSEAALLVDPSLTDDDLEFIEIYNPTSQAVNLTDWRLRRGADFDFPANLTLGPRQSLIVASFDAADPANSNRLQAFRTHYGLSGNELIVGGFQGKLDNGSDTIQLQRPDEPPLDAPNVIPRLLEDEVRYDDNQPWPVSADGGGNSLNRVLPAAFGYDASSWNAETPSPGSVAGVGIVGDFNGDQIVDEQDITLLCTGIQNQIIGFDLNGDAAINPSDLDYMIETVLGTSFGDADLDGTFDSGDFVTVFVAGEYEDNVAGNSTWSEGDWNCDGDFTTGDLVIAFEKGGYVDAATAIPNSIASAIHGTPEPKLNLERDVDDNKVQLRGPIAAEIALIAASTDAVFSELDDDRFGLMFNR